MPFLLESRLRELGGLFENADEFQAISVENGKFITGQNPPSASLVANSILRVMGISPYKSEAA